jgi:hypothetical protein
MAVRKRKIVRREWTKSDMKELLAMARSKVSARAIGRKLKRTEGAVRQKAFAVGISLNSRKRAAGKRR